MIEERWAEANVAVAGPHRSDRQSSAFSTTCSLVGKQSTSRQVAASCTLLRGVSDTLGDSGRPLRKVHGPRTLP